MPPRNRTSASKAVSIVGFFSTLILALLLYPILMEDWLRIDLASATGIAGANTAEWVTWIAILYIILQVFYGIVHPPQRFMGVVVDFMVSVIVVMMLVYAWSVNRQNFTSFQWLVWRVSALTAFADILLSTAVAVRVATRTFDVE